MLKYCSECQQELKFPNKFGNSYILVKAPVQVFES